MSCSTCPDRANSVVVNGAATVAGGGTPVAVPLPAAGEVDAFNTVTVINDTDKDIKVQFRTERGNSLDFIVPKSIKAFTKKVRENIVNSSVKVYSTDAATAATGNITFNFSN